MVSWARSGAAARGADAVGNTRAERAGPTGGQVRPGQSVLVGDVGHEGDLGYVLGDYPVVGHYRTDGPQVAELGLEIGDSLEVPGPKFGDLGCAVLPAAVVPAEGFQEQPAGLGRVAVDAQSAGAVAVELVGVDVDLHHGLALAHAPLDVGKLHAGADTEHHVGGGPEVAAHREIGVEPMARVEHPEAHVSGEHRSLQRLGQLPDRLGGVLCSSADHYQRAPGLPEDAGGLLDPVGVQCRLGGAGRYKRAVGRLAPHVDGHLDGHGTGERRTPPRPPLAATRRRHARHCRRSRCAW